MAKLIRTHNSIDFIKTDDKLELYYFRDEDVTGTTIKGLARLGNLPISTLRDLVERLERGAVISLKTLEIPTAGGTQGGRLILENDIPKVLTELQKGRASKKTKAAAANLMKKLAQAGFRLGVLLEVDIVSLAKEVVSHTMDPQEIKGVTNVVADRAKYIDSYWGSQGALKAHGAEGWHHARYNKTINKYAGVKDGERGKMTRLQQAKMTMMQSATEIRLMEGGPTNGPDHATNRGLKASRSSLESIGCVIDAGK